MSDSNILFICSQCRVMFKHYPLGHECSSTTDVSSPKRSRPKRSAPAAEQIFPSLEDFAKTQQPASEAYVNYSYVRFIRDKMTELPDGVAKLSLQKAEKNFLKGTKSPTGIAFPDLGDVTFKNVSFVMTRKQFTKSHLTLMYNNEEAVFPRHFTVLRSKADLYFWPFFFSTTHIFSAIFSPIIRVEENECFVFLESKKWERRNLDEVLRTVCNKVIVPLLETLGSFAVDCIRSKSSKKCCILNKEWESFEGAKQVIKFQLNSMCGGEWFAFFESLPRAFEYLGPNLPSVTQFVCLDSILKGQIDVFSREWIPFLGLLCDRDRLKEKYGE